MGKEQKRKAKLLKIAVLGHKTIPSRQGGIEIVVEELTVRMAKLGHKITVYNRSGHHVSGKEFDSKKLKEYKGVRLKYVLTIDGVQQYFLDTYRRKTVFIPNGVNRPVIREAKMIKEKFGLEKDSYILFLGRLVPEKGLRYLIQAFKEVKTDKKLVIAGGSSDTDAFAAELQEMAKGDDRILFTGFVQGQELDELYSNAYVYTLPSDLEGMPLSLLEAMSYGNCCLVSDIEECASVVEDKALVFKKADVNDLREKLQTVCEKEDVVQKRKEEAADFICEKYNWDDVVRRTLKLYRR